MNIPYIWYGDENIIAFCKTQSRSALNIVCENILEYYYYCIDALYHEYHLRPAGFFFIWQICRLINSYLLQQWKWSNYNVNKNLLSILDIYEKMMCILLRNNRIWIIRNDINAKTTARQTLL